MVDVENGRLQNIIEFEPESRFVVDASIQVASSQRLDFVFEGAFYQEGNKKPFRVPPFGKGWSDLTLVLVNLSSMLRLLGLRISILMMRSVWPEIYDKIRLSVCDTVQLSSYRRECGWNCGCSIDMTPVSLNRVLFPRWSCAELFRNGRRLDGQRALLEARAVSVETTSKSDDGQAQVLTRLGSTVVSTTGTARLIDRRAV